MKSSTPSKPAGKALARAVVASMETIKAEHIAIYRVNVEGAVTDWFIIASGNGPTHTSAVARAVFETVKQAGVAPVYREGTEEGRWAVLDYSDVVVHVLSPEMREYYEIEKLWVHYERFTPQKLAGRARA